MVQRTSSILFNDVPVVQPRTLICIFGWEQAHFIQQVHWWLLVVLGGRGGKIDENGRPWFYRSIAEWEDELFPLIRRGAINKYRRNLTKKGILIQVEEINKAYWGGSRTWYSLNYEKLDELYAEYLKNPPISPKQRRINKAQEGMSQRDIPPISRRDIHTESTYTENTENREDNPDLPAAASGSPAAQLVAGSQFSGISRRKRSEEKRVKSEEDRRAKISHDDLTPLGRFVLEQCGRGTNFSVAPALTRAQVDDLAAEYEVPYKGTTRLITPDDLFLSDPYYTDWIKTEVYTLLRAQGGDKPIARGKMVGALTMGGTVVSLKQFLEWREQFIEKQQMDYALAHAETTPEKDYFNFDSLDDDLDDLDEGDETDGS